MSDSDAASSKPVSKEQPAPADRRKSKERKELLEMEKMIAMQFPSMARARTGSSSAGAKAATHGAAVQADLSPASSLDSPGHGKDSAVSGSATEASGSASPSPVTPV